MKTKNFFLICFLISLLKELLQLLLNAGMFDVDDIILNVLGETTIYFVYKKLCHKQEVTEQSKTTKKI